MPLISPELLGFVVGAVLILAAFTIGYLLGSRARRQRFHEAATVTTPVGKVPDHVCEENWGVHRAGEDFWRCYICGKPGPKVGGIKR